MAQISQPSVKYLCFELSKGLRDPLCDRREALARIAVPTTGDLGEWLGFVKFGFPILA